MTAPIAERSNMWAVISTLSNAVKTALFSLFVPLVVGVWVPERMILSGQDRLTESGALGLSGSALFVIGVIGYLWCAALFVRAQGTPAPIFPTRRTVVEGPYHVNRNPMYTSVLAVVFGQAALFEQWRVAAYGVFLFACFHLFVLLYEERDLRARFGGEYEEFCRRVPRWVPRLK